MIRTMLECAACLVLGVDTLDALELARRVTALHHLAAEAEDRAEVAEAAAGEVQRGNVRLWTEQLAHHHDLAIVAHNARVARERVKLWQRRATILKLRAEVGRA